MKTKGEMFKMLRECNKITQSQMADFLNVDQSYISKFEADERQLSIDLLEKCSDLFGCSVKVFFEETTEMPAMKMAFRTANTNSIELKDLAMINRIAMNLEMMEKLEKE
ncbi:MAG: helix-turn-helix transcriptional regulator [Erysipelotrichaceae bacterium]